MPKIAEFQAPEGLGLRPTEVGITATAAAARRVGAEYSEAAGSKSAAGHMLGSAISVAGEVAVRAIEHREISSGSVNFANFIAAKTKQWEDISKSADPNDPTVASQFMEGLEPDLDKLKGGMITERGQQFAESHASAFRSHMVNKTAADMATKAGEAAKINAEQTVNALSSAVRSDTSERSMDFAIKTLEGTLGASIDASPNLGGAKAATMRMEITQKGMERLVKSRAMGEIENTGEVPKWISDPKYSKYVNVAELKEFQRAAQFYDRMKKAADKSDQEEQKRAAVDDLMEKTFEIKKETYPKDVGDLPTLPADYWKRLSDLADHPGAKIHPAIISDLYHEGVAITNRLNKPEPPAHKSNSVYMQLSRKISGIDGTYMASEKEIFDHADELTRGDINALRNEFRDFKNGQGETLRQQKSELLKRVHPALVTYSDVMDTTAELRTQQYRKFVDSKIDEYRKAGKDPTNLFDPDNPDYVARPEVLRRYQSDATRRMQGMPGVVGGAKPPVDIPARNPGESLSDWMNRTGRRLGQ